MGLLHACMYLMLGDGMFVTKEVIQVQRTTLESILVFVGLLALLLWALLLSKKIGAPGKNTEDEGKQSENNNRKTKKEL